MRGPVDAHVHLWNRAADPQPWIDPVTMAAIDRDFGSGDLQRMLERTHIDRAVVVQTSNSLAETRRLLSDPGRCIAGVVGWIDLTGDAGAQLDALAGARRRLVGIRHLVHVDSDPDWLSRPDVGAALKELGIRGLCFDLVLRSWQLPQAATIAGAYPGVRFVVDHLGGVAESTDDAGWESGLRALAAHSNVRAKISGLAGLVAEPDRLCRVVGVALEAFGPDRLMYGSDWPLACLSADLVAWRMAVAELIGELSEDERRAIMSGTATASYRLGA